MHRTITILLLAAGVALCLCAMAHELGTVVPDAAEAGRKLITETHSRLPDYVGNGLNCSNCHLDAGTRSGASSWVGIWGLYPQYRSRSGKIISLQQRINDCLLRSMNGKVLPENSLPMQNMLAYIQWLSRDVDYANARTHGGFGSIDVSLIADPVRGRQIYSDRCASCHGANGLGVRSKTGYSAPPLWGAESFNDGAGMARTYTAAAFVKFNMPYNAAGSLSDQQALDVAEYFTHQSRPVYAGKSADWPKGDRPRDARN